MGTSDGYGPFGAPDGHGQHDQNRSEADRASDQGLYGADPYGSSPYGAEPYEGYGGSSPAADPYASRPPAPSGSASSASSAPDPYAPRPGVTDPYGNGPTSADGFGPEFTADGWTSGPPMAGPPMAGPAVAGPPVAGPPVAGPPYPGAPGHAQVQSPPYGTYLMPAPTSGMALAGFIVGISSLFLCAGLPAPVGLVLSILGMRETSPSSGSGKGGRGFAIAGLVISILGTLVLALMVAYFVLIIGLGVWGSTQ